MKCLAVVAVAVSVALPAAAQESAPHVSGRPLPRPEREPGPGVPVQITPRQADDKADSALVLPPPTIATGQRDLLRLDDASYASCLVALRDLGMEFEEVAAVISDDDGDCGILQPVKVSRIAPKVDLIPAAVLRCPTAQALAVWVQDFVLPASDRLNGLGTLTAIEGGSGYMCRRRNNQAEGALSEHAYGNAFDVMGFRFEHGKSVMIAPIHDQDSLTQAFQDAVRATACLDFATVLGPGSNAYHDDHLHVDIKTRNGGFRVCELGVNAGSDLQDPIDRRDHQDGQ